MRTFNTDSIITWSNRDKAEIGKKYYFADTLDALQKCVDQNTSLYELDRIDENDLRTPFKCRNGNHSFYYACILSENAVKGPKKTYRECRTIKELYELLTSGEKCDNSDISTMTDADFAFQLITNTVVHIKSKNSGQMYYTGIGFISLDGGYLIVSLNNTFYHSIELLINYEIEINGEWRPFGILN